jgi:Tfp pilus assembly protein PilF
MSYQILKILLVVTIAIKPNQAGAQIHSDIASNSQTSSALSRARAALQRRDFEMAAKAYEEVLAREPHDRTALIGLARIHYYSYHPEPALKIYRQLLQHDSRDVEANLAMAQTYNYLGKYALAEKHLRAVLAFQPDNGEAIWTLSRTYLYQNRLQEADRLLERSMTQHKRDYRFWESLGEVKYRQGHYEDGRRDLDRALELNSSATRSSSLLKHLAETGGEEGHSSFRVLEFRDYAYLLHDGVGNTIFSSPQEFVLGYGNRWRSRFSGEYRHLSRSGRENAPPPAHIMLLKNSNEFRVTDRISIEASAGTAYFLNAGVNRSIYGGGVTLQPIPNLRLAAHYGQDVLAPTLRAANLALTQKGWSTTLDYKWRDNLLNLQYYQARILDGNSSNGGTAWFRRCIWHGPFDLSLGYKVDALSFARIDLFHGYFSPQGFIAQSGTVEISGHKGRLHFDYELALGGESYTRPMVTSFAPLLFSVTRNSNFRALLQARNSVDLNKNLSLQFSFVSFHTALSDGSGSYNANAVLFGLAKRF